MKLKEHQADALKRMKNGCILCGGTGSGKSRTGIAYFYTQNGGDLERLDFSLKLQDLYIITTARKRDNREWESDELLYFHMSTDPELNCFNNKIVIDSWNNIGKYKNVTGAFFIFDEQRVVGYGPWTTTFINISKKNNWIMLSATPGDKWIDYCGVFIANGFYKHKSHFIHEHVQYMRGVTYPMISGYFNTKRLDKYRDMILIDMDFERSTTQNHIDIWSNYDSKTYKELWKTRMNPNTCEPFKNASEMCSALRKLVNSDVSRMVKVLELIDKNPRVIIFYNYNYELDILRNLYYGDDVVVAEWNGFKHEDVPNTDKWVYLVQYAAGAEAWNCITTDTIIFYSQNYSYKVMVQAAGRIDRLNTPYRELYYYHFKSHSGIDSAIAKALREKKKFNERNYVTDIFLAHK